jgi:hypothetical protein
LDPEYELDPQQFAPKVLTLFGEARRDQNKTRCSLVCEEARRLLTTNATALLKLIQSAPSGCSCLDILSIDAAEVFYKEGLEAYKENNFPRALESLKTALTFNPRNELATQYIDLTQNKLQLTVDRLVLDWRKSFDAKEFPQAIAVYRQLASPSLGDKSPTAIAQIRSEYRKSVSGMADVWKQNCTARLGQSLDVARRAQASAILPDPSIASDIIGQMTPCVVETPPVVDAQSCLQMSSQLAMVRIRSRVDPDIPRLARPNGRMVVKVNIDKTGKVVVHDVEGADSFLNARVKTAVEQWRFTPAIVAEQPRCVDTELPIVLTPQ